VKSIFPFALVLTVLSAAMLLIFELKWVAPPSFGWQIIILLAISTLLIYYYLLDWHQTRPDLFTQFYLASIALKILAYGAVIGIIIYFDKPGAVPNAILFLICYVIFTLLEVAFLFRKISGGPPSK
jgi:hypothetical protein